MNSVGNPRPRANLLVRGWRRLFRRRTMELAIRVQALEAGVLELQRLVIGQPETATRWANSRPDSNLTWGEPLKGDAFVQEVELRGGFGPEKRILELGPGYGRLIEAILRSGYGFREYVGVDISSQNVAFLRRSSQDPRTRFLEGDIESSDLGIGFNTIISSLTLKHLYPIFERTLANVRRAAKDDAMLVFDLLEMGPGANQALLEHDQTAREEATYIRRYTKDEVTHTVASAGFRVREFSHVTHRPMFRRLLVVCTPIPFRGLSQISVSG